MISSKWACMALSMAASTLAQGDIAALLQSQPDLSTLAELVLLVPGLAETLSTASNVTILAPTNRAFEELDPTIPEAVAVRDRNVTSVSALLANHVIRGLYPSDSVGDVPTYVQTLVDATYANDVQPFTNTTGGQYIGLVTNRQDVNVLSGEFTVSNVTQADIQLGASITIHVIDTVLSFGAPFQLFAGRAGLRAMNNAIQVAGIDDGFGLEDTAETVLNDADLTFFVPVDEAFEAIGSILATVDQASLADVLKYHVIPGNIIFSPSWSNTSVASLQGDELELSVLDDGSLFVDNARIIFPNIILFNGVVHIIDTVLNPSSPLIDRSNLDAALPASERTAFPSATSTSALPFTTYPYAMDTYTTPELLQTILPIAAASTGATTTTGVPIEHGTQTPSPTAVFTGAAKQDVIGVAEALIGMGIGMVGALM